MSSQNSNFSSQEPINLGDRPGGSVIARNANIDVFQRRIAVAQCNAGNVHVAGFNNGLSVGTGIGDDQKTGFLEFLGVLIGKGTGGPSGLSSGSASNVLSEFNDGALTVIS